MAEVLKDNIMVIKEYRKFESETARMPKDAWKKRVSESSRHLTLSQDKTLDGYGLRSISKGKGMSEWIATAV